MARHIFAVICFVTLLTGLSLGSTILPDTTISSTMTWHKNGNPYTATGIITVDSGASLTIEAGVRILFDGGPSGINSGIVVRRGGFLYANGQPGDSILLLGSGRMRNGFVVAYGYVNLNYCRFENTNGNFGDGYGGALLFNGCDSGLANHCMFYRNTCPLRGGGAISGKCTSHAWPIARAKIKDCYFFGNHVDNFGSGGAIILEENSIIDIIGCTFDSNYVEGWGYGGAIHIQSAVCGSIRNNIFKNNCAYYGGAIFSNYGMEDSFFIEGNLFYHNHGTRAGTILLGYPTPGNFTNTIYFINNTVVENSADTTGGIEVTAGLDPTAKNNIVWNNSASVDPQIDAHFLEIARFSCIMGYSDSSRGDMDQYPLFSNPTYYDYRLTRLSPCIDAGDTSSSKNPDSTRADIGAYYFHQTGGSGDANNDCNVSGLDAVFLVCYLKGMGPAPYLKWKADANGNCHSDGVDVTFMVNYFKGKNRGPLKNSSCIWTPSPPPDPCTW